MALSHTEESHVLFDVNLNLRYVKRKQQAPASPHNHDQYKTAAYVIYHRLQKRQLQLFLDIDRTLPACRIPADVGVSGVSGGVLI